MQLQTGTDPQPYFRVFNCTSQSEKCDPTGAYIRQWVPELKHIKDKTIHEPSVRMTAQAFKATGYLKPIVDHKETRERALFRYKNVGLR
jgi:deoxyribodipyrimidine photo-lyase